MVKKRPRLTDRNRDKDQSTGAGGHTPEQRDRDQDPQKERENKCGRMSVTGESTWGVYGPLLHCSFSSAESVKFLEWGRGR